MNKGAMFFCVGVLEEAGGCGDFYDILLIQHMYSRTRLFSIYSIFSTEQCLLAWWYVQYNKRGKKAEHVCPRDGKIQLLRNGTEWSMV